MTSSTTEAQPHGVVAALSWSIGSGEGGFDAQSRVVRRIVIASREADFTPLLQVVRADDRRITIIATGSTAPAYEALADRYGSICAVGGVRLL